MNRIHRAALIGVAICATVLLAGCPPQAPSQTLPPPMSFDQVVGKVNENNDHLLWLKGSISDWGGELVEPDGTRTSLGLLGLRGHIWYAQPNHLFIDVIKGEQTVMELGSNERFYWLWVQPPGRHGKCWVGSYERWNASAGKGLIPIHPQQLAQLLGIDAIPADSYMQARPVWPILRVSDPADRSYVVEFMTTGDGRMILQRELWLDRDTNRPRRVRLFDGGGQVVFDSTPSDWQPVTSGSKALVPRSVDIQSIVVKPVTNDKGELTGVVQENGTRMRLTFAGVTVDDKFSVAKRAAMYQFHCPPDIERVNLDEVAATQPNEGDSN